MSKVKEITKTVQTGYTELANQLKFNKTKSIDFNKFTNAIKDDSGCKEIVKNRRMQSCSLTGLMLMNTKDNTLNTLRVSVLNKFGNIEIEGPEEMHFFNASVALNNKRLAYKFENVDEELEESTL
jgi:hypothetical protein